MSTRGTWAVLGAGSSLPRAGYGPAGYALRPRPGAPVTLFDCGPGTVRALPTVQIDLLEVERVVLTHFHLDHCLDLFALFFARNNPGLAPVPPLEVIGPRGLVQACERTAGALGRWARDPDVSLLEVEPAAGAAGPLARAGLRLSWVATGHTPEAVAWRADLEGGSSVAYSGDSPEEPAIATLASDVGLFVCECSFPDDDPAPGHLTPSSAARLALAAGARRLLLTHFYPATDPRLACEQAARTFPGSIQAAHDGLVVEL